MNNLWRDWNPIAISLEEFRKKKFHQHKMMNAKVAKTQPIRLMMILDLKFLLALNIKSVK